MTPGTEVRLSLEPVVSRPRAMTLGRPHLVAVDLRLAGPVEDWPYDEEEFAFTCVLDGSSGLSAVAVHDATVLVHRFGGSYGPAEFVVTPGETIGDHSLWLTILTPRGVVIHTSELPVRVRAESPDDTGTATRSILAQAPVLRRPTDPDAADSSVRYVSIVIGAVEGTGGQVDYEHRLRSLIRNAFRAAGVSDGDYDIRELIGDDMLCVLHPRSARAVPEFLIQLRRAGIRLRVVLDRFVEEPGRSTPLLLVQILSSSTLRAAEELDGSVAVIVADGAFQELIGGARRLPPWTFRRARLSALPGEGVIRAAWFSVPSPERLHSDLGRILGDLFAQETIVSLVLEEIAYPHSGRPAIRDPQDFWARIVGDLARDHGRVVQLAEMADRYYPGHAELRRITRALQGSEPPSYPVLTLVGSERYDDFLRSVSTRIDPMAEVLYASARQCAVLITDQEPPAEELRRLTSGWGPDARVEFRRYAFRPSTLDGLRVRGIDGRIFELRGVPTTLQIRAISQEVVDEYLAPDVSHDFELERTDPDGTLRRLDPDQMLHDAGILDGDELRLVPATQPNLFTESVDRLVRYLRRPNTHLIVDGGAVADLGYGDLPANDQRARVVTGLGQVARETGAEITCVFDGAELTVPVAVEAPRGVRVLYCAPGQSARELLGRFAQTEPPERPVMIVSSDSSLARSERQNPIGYASPALLLRWLTEAAGDVLRLFWLLDCSGSMAVDGKIDAVNDGMERAIADLREFAAERSGLRLAARAVTFSKGARWHPEDPTPIEAFNWPSVTAGGRTDLGAALWLLSCELQQLSTSSRKSSAIVILVTDGQPTDEWRSEFHEFLDTSVGIDAVRRAISIGEEADRSTVREFLAHAGAEPRQADTPEQISAAIRDVSLEAAKTAWARPLRSPRRRL